MGDQEIENFRARSRKEWRKWLLKNHLIKHSVWLVVHKKSSPEPTLEWSDAVDEALCFGWIDSKKQTIDQNSYRQYYSKRKTTSTWSKINKDKVDLLIEKKLMTQAGLVTIEIAKENGSWNILDSVESLIIPADLQLEFSKRKGSEDFFDSLSKSNKKILLYWIVSAKRAETRQKRIKEIAVCAGKNLKPKQFR